MKFTHNSDLNSDCAPSGRYVVAMGSSSPASCQADLRAARPAVAGPWARPCRCTAASTAPSTTSRAWAAGLHGWCLRVAGQLEALQGCSQAQ